MEVAAQRISQVPKIPRGNSTTTTSDHSRHRCISESLTLITRTLQNNLVVPSWGYFCGIIREIYETCAPIRDGRVADYIPQLSRQDPAHWGVAICTIDGQRFALGDTSQCFCLQSVSKAFNYALAASELGADVVHQYVGQEVGECWDNLAIMVV